MEAGESRPQMTDTSAPILFDEVIDFLASGPGSETIIGFQPSEMLKQRSQYLLDRNRQDLLSAEERAELDEFTRMNHFMNMLKIRARQRLAHA
jgi:hypothetical protein